MRPVRLYVVAIFRLVAEFINIKLINHSHVVAVGPAHGGHGVAGRDHVPAHRRQRQQRHQHGRIGDEQQSGPLQLSHGQQWWLSDIYYRNVLIIGTGTWN